MNYNTTIPFPFPNTTFIRFYNGQTRMALINCEAAITPDEINQSLNFRSLLHFRKPMVLHFPDPSRQTGLCFRFRFDAEVIVVNRQGIVEKIYPIRKSTTDEALHIHFFGGYDAAIIAPVGFAQQWNIQPGNTNVKKISLAEKMSKTA
jgi:hypothetical protein